MQVTGIQPETLKTAHKTNEGIHAPLAMLGEVDRLTHHEMESFRFSEGLELTAMTGLVAREYDPSGLRWLGDPVSQDERRIKPYLSLGIAICRSALFNKKLRKRFHCFGINAETSEKRPSGSGCRIDENYLVGQALPPLPEQTNGKGTLACSGRADQEKGFPPADKTGGMNLDEM